MKKIRIIFLAVVCLAFVSCYENDDKYGAGKEMSVTGVDDVYNKTALIDVLHIEPSVKVTDTGDELEYQWRLWRDYSNDSGTPKDLVIKTIGTEKTLDYLVVEKPDTYRVEFKATNKTTGQEVYAVTTLKVTNQFSKGFYVLKDMGTATDMDLHTDDGTLMSDVIEKVQGARLPGMPNSLSVLPKYNYIHTETLVKHITTTLNVATTDGFWIIDIANLNVGYDLETMFYFPPETGNSLFSTFIYYGAIYLSDKGIYYTTYDLVWGSGGSGMFGTAVSITDGYRPNKHITADRYYTYFFDELNGRFLTINYNGALYACSNQNSAGNTPDISTNNISETMVFFGRNRLTSAAANGRGFAIMQDPATPSTRYLYEMTLNGLTTNPMLSKRTITGLNLNQATLFANCENQARVLYYAVGGKVYTYLIDDQVEQELTLTDFGAGEEITYIKNIYWTAASTDTGKFNYLAIGTWSGGNYKIYLYSIVAGVPVGSPRVLQGEGKAIGMQYVTPDFTVNIGNYQYPIGL